MAGNKRTKIVRTKKRPFSSKETVINVSPASDDDAVDDYDIRTTAEESGDATFYNHDFGFDLSSVALMKDSKFFRAAVHFLVRIITAIVIISVSIIVSVLREEPRAVVYVLLVTSVLISITYICDVPGWNDENTPTLELVLLWNWWAIASFLFKVCVSLAFPEAILGNVIGAVVLIVLLLLLFMANSRLRSIPGSLFFILFLLPIKGVGIFDEASALTAFRVLLMFAVFLLLDWWLPVKAAAGKDCTATKTITHRSLFLLIYSSWILVVIAWWWVLALFVLLYGYVIRSRRRGRTVTSSSPSVHKHTENVMDVEEEDDQSINGEDEDLLSDDSIAAYDSDDVVEELPSEQPMDDDSDEVISNTPSPPPPQALGKKRKGRSRRKKAFII